MTHKYDDIINLPHHVSEKHPQMSMQSRAAQFAPFSALSGHGAAIRETARQTSRFIEYDDNHAEMLDRKIHTLLEGQYRHTTTAITYFKPDKRKAGGSYRTVRSVINEIDTVNKTLILPDGETIPFEYIYDIETVCPDTETDGLTR
jgi:hypothetical protein